jgi:hypothetical protein
MTLSESGSLGHSVMWTELECELDSITSFFSDKMQRVPRRAFSTHCAYVIRISPLNTQVHRDVRQGVWTVTGLKTSPPPTP